MAGGSACSVARPERYDGIIIDVPAFFFSTPKGTDKITRHTPRAHRQVLSTLQLDRMTDDDTTTSGPTALSSLAHRRKWLPEEDSQLVALVTTLGRRGHWNMIARVLKTKNAKQLRIAAVPARLRTRAAPLDPQSCAHSVRACDCGRRMTTAAVVRRARCVPCCSRRSCGKTLVKTPRV